MVADDDRRAEGPLRLDLLSPGIVHGLRLHRHEPFNLRHMKGFSEGTAREGQRKPRNPRRRNADLIEHAEERRGGPVNHGAVAATQAHGLQGAPVETPRPGEAAHEGYVQARAPLYRHAGLEGVERAHLFPLAAAAESSRRSAVPLPPRHHHERSPTEVGFHSDEGEDQTGRAFIKALKRPARHL